MKCDDVSHAAGGAFGYGGAASQRYFCSVDVGHNPRPFPRCFYYYEYVLLQGTVLLTADIGARRLELN